MALWIRRLLFAAAAAPSCGVLTNLENTLSRLITSIIEMFQGFSPF
ncbi:MAG: hypothetical protein OEV06_10375 [Anaerolineae bacterium]|nr:hypothetical protein [Anaerolineae bacterium]